RKNLESSSRIASSYRTQIDALRFTYEALTRRALTYHYNEVPLSVEK
ncbi:unnamed protein product, partial [Amoebophrya sp. A25]